MWNAAKNCDEFDRKRTANVHVGYLLQWSLFRPKKWKEKKNFLIIIIVKSLKTSSAGNNFQQ